MVSSLIVMLQDVNNAYSKLTLENTEGTIWNVQLRDTDTDGYT